MGPSRQNNPKQLNFCFESTVLMNKCLHSLIALPEDNPYHRTIRNFRKNNQKEIEKYFVDVMRVFGKLGYPHIGKIYLDGTQIKGNASAKRAKDHVGFKKWLSEIEEETTTVLKEAETIDNREDLQNRSGTKGITEEVIRAYIPEKEDRRKVVLILGSSGLKEYGEGEWKVRQYGYFKRRTWRKIHLAVTPDGKVRAVELTQNSISDDEAASKLPE